MNITEIPVDVNEGRHLTAEFLLDSCKNACHAARTRVAADGHWLPIAHIGCDSRVLLLHLPLPADQHEARETFAEVLPWALRQLGARAAVLPVPTHTNPKTIEVPSIGAAVRQATNGTGPREALLLMAVDQSPQLLQARASIRRRTYNHPLLGDWEDQVPIPHPQTIPALAGAMLPRALMIGIGLLAP